MPFDLGDDSLCPSGVEASELPQVAEGMDHQPVQASAGVAWEYKTVVLGINNSEFQRELNGIANDGWELVQVLEENSVAIFKRPKK